MAWRNHPNVIYNSNGTFGGGNRRDGKTNPLAHTNTQTEPIFKREPQAAVKPQNGLTVVEIGGKKLIMRLIARKDSEKELTIMGIACAPEELLVIATAQNRHPDPFKKQFALATSPSGETYVLENEADCASLEKSVRGVKYLLARAIDGKEDGELISKLQDMPQFSGFDFYLEEREVPQKQEQKKAEKKRESFPNEAPRYVQLPDATYAVAKAGKTFVILGELVSKSVYSETYLSIRPIWADASKGEIGLSWGSGNKELRILRSMEEHEQALLDSEAGDGMHKYIVIKPCRPSESKRIADEVLIDLGYEDSKYVIDLRRDSSNHRNYSIRVAEFGPASQADSSGFSPIKGLLQGGFREFGGRDEYLLSFNKEKKEAQVLGLYINGDWPLGGEKHLWATASMGEIGVATKKGSEEFFLLDGGGEHSQFLESPHFAPGEYTYYIIKRVHGDKLRSLVRDYENDGLPAQWHNMLKFTGCALIDASPASR